MHQKFIDLLSESTVYGLSQFFLRKQIFFKLFWLVFLLTGSIVSVYFIWDSINAYLDYEVITKIESKYEQPMLFPTISFCPYSMNYFDTKPLNSIIRECWFNLDRSCQINPNNYFEKFNSFRGDCFRFNSGKNMSDQTIPFLYSTIGGKDDSFFLKFVENSGLQLWIHEVSLPPKFGDHNNHLGNMIYVSPRAETQLIINKLEDKKLGLPYNQCYEDYELMLFPGNRTIIDFIKSRNETYKQTNCFELCYEVNYLNEDPCFCTKTSLGNVWQDCFDKHEKKNKSGCTYNNKLNFFKESVLTKCKEFCPLECDTISYSVNFNVYTDLDETMFSVYFESLKYTLISQIPKEKGFDLLSNVGGILGLFIGVSFVTLFEICELFIEMLLMLHGNKKTNQPVQITPVVNSLND